MAVKKTSPFNYINAINTSKNNLMRGSNNDTIAEKEYSPFLTNRALSYFNDTIGYANEMNQRFAVDNLLQFEYLLNIVRPKKRFSKWVKKDNDRDMTLVKEYYGYNNTKAIQALSILSSHQIKIIREKLEKGGV
ncbi:MAG: DNA polymerase [Verrucomicrobiales bacterium]|jgi:hypothetical protein|nr:DNA polymerase [Verrucomicrobiales bacterium]|tara:strand:+ start:1876 stop:2277 length:402 start_codon:yes stop_codon:yes gene_type:complete